MTQTFLRTLQLPVPAEQAFAWHERPGALDRLIPPWEPVAVVKRGDGVQDGSIVVLAQRLGPLRLKWVAKHHDYHPGQSFRDTQVSGPFARWEHLHAFKSNGSGHGVLTDHIQYQIPAGFVGRWLGGRMIRRKLEQMFAYRHRTTYDDLAAHARYADRQAMHVAVTGASGLVGRTLLPLLTTGGHGVTRLVRHQAGVGEVTWNPAAEQFDASALSGLDAVVHLAGENIAAARWTPAVKDKIRNSRVHATRVLCEGLARLATPPKTLICASAIGFYGHRGDQRLTEQDAAGSGFLADVAEQWEAATKPARQAGIRVVQLRFGMVLSPRGGALAKMRTPFKLGAGGRIADGRQFWSWISIDDAAGAIHHAIMNNSVAGPVNTVAPNPVTNAEFTKTLARVLGRPAVVPMPAMAARIALGEMADELLLASIRVVPEKLAETGYVFRQPDLEPALRHLLGRSS